MAPKNHRRVIFVIIISPKIYILPCHSRLFITRPILNNTINTESTRFQLTLTISSISDLEM